MGEVNGIFTASLQAANDGVNASGGGEVIKLEFTPQSLGAARQRNGKYPPTVAVSEDAIEAALLRHFGFDAGSPADLARVKELLQTADSPFAALKTTGDLVAVYNSRTGKYEILDTVEKNLYLRLRGKAAEIKTQIEREKQNPAATSQANPNEVLASRDGIANNKRAELENKLNNRPFVTALDQNKAEKNVELLTGAIETVTGTGDPLGAGQIGKQFNRLAVSTLRLTGKAMEWSNYFGEKLNDALRYVAPDSIDALLDQVDRNNRQNAQALQNASTSVTREDVIDDLRNEKLGNKVPLTEDLANKIMYFPEAIPNAIDSAVRGDFKDDDRSYSDSVGKMVGGLNPAGDLRDIVANGQGIYEGKRGAWIGFGGSVLGVFPIVGDGAKILIKAEKEAIADVADRLVRNGVGREEAEKIAGEEVERLFKEAVEKRYDEIAANGHAVQRHGAEVTEAKLDDRAMYGKDPVTGTTDDAYNKFPDGTPKPHKAGKNATKFASREALVRAEQFVRNSQSYRDNLDEAISLGSPRFEVKGVKLEEVFGPNYKDFVFGKTRIGSRNNPIGTTETDFTDGTITAFFQKDAAGNWNLVTMYPEPK